MVSQYLSKLLLRHSPMMRPRFSPFLLLYVGCNDADMASQATKDFGTVVAMYRERREQYSHVTLVDPVEFVPPYCLLTHPMQKAAASVYMEATLPYLIHVLAHYPNLVDDMPGCESIQRILLVFFTLVLRSAPDCAHFMAEVLLRCKQCTDAVDLTNAEVII